MFEPGHTKREQKALSRLLAWTPRTAEELQHDANLGRLLRRLAALFVLLALGFGAFAVFALWHGATLASPDVRSNVSNALVLMSLGCITFWIVDGLGWNIRLPLRLASAAELDAIADGLSAYWDAPGMDALADRIMATEPLYAADASALGAKFAAYCTVRVSAECRAEREERAAARSAASATEYTDGRKRLADAVATTFPSHDPGAR